MFNHLDMDQTTEYLPTVDSLSLLEESNAKALVPVSTPTCSLDFSTQFLESPVKVPTPCKIFLKNAVLAIESRQGKATGSVSTIGE